MKSIKIVGLSGVGKTTLIRAVQQQRSGITHVGYSDLLARYGVDANVAWEVRFLTATGIVLVDDHLEYGIVGLAEKYQREHTAGILVLDCSFEQLLARRLGDRSRLRSSCTKLAAREQRLSANRAEQLADALAIPMLHLQSASLHESFTALDSLITAARRA